MKLSDYAKQQGISYRTAHRMWKRGEHKDRLTRVGFNYIKVLLNSQGKDVEIINEAREEKEDLMQDFISIITSFCARIYGMRRQKRKTECIIECLENEE